MKIPPEGIIPDFTIGYYTDLKYFTKEHIFMDDPLFPDPLCGCKIIESRFEQTERGDISSQESMTGLRDSGFLGSLCGNCMKSLIKLGKEFDVIVDPVKWRLE